MSPNSWDTPRGRGHALGNALARLFVVRSEDVVNVYHVAMTFAEWCGFREMRSGGEFCTGFIQGINDGTTDTQPKQIDMPLKNPVSDS